MGRYRVEAAASLRIAIPLEGKRQKAYEGKAAETIRTLWRGKRGGKCRGLPAKKKMSEFYLSARRAARTMRFEVYITLAKTCQNFGSTPQRIWKVFPKAQYALPPRDIRRNLRIFKIFLYFKFIKFSDYPYRRPRKKLISLRKARLKKTMDSKGGKKIAKNAQTAFCPVHFFTA